MKELVKPTKLKKQLQCTELYNECGENYCVYNKKDDCDYNVCTYNLNDTANDDIIF